MPYTVKQLSDLTGVSVRTLHYYDEIGLLKPDNYGENGYRQYGEEDMMRLQQILFFKELDFSLKDIREILGRPDFDILQALHTHKTLLASKMERLQNLVATVDRTILNLKGELDMEKRDYFEGFDEEQIEKYKQEARELYGKEAVEESEKRTKHFTKDDYKRLTDRFDQYVFTIRDHMQKGPACQEVQEQVANIHKWLHNYYDCPLERLLGVGYTYRDHEGFARMFRTKFHEDMPEFIFQAIEHYCNTQTNE